MQSFLEFAGHHPYLSTAAALLAAAIVATEAKRLTRRWREVGPFELTQLVNGGAQLLDLRDAAAHRAGHIAGARPVALDELDALAAKLPKGESVVTCCESGADSARAAQRLAEAGLTKVATLRGGLSAWRAENLPLVKG